MQKDTFTYLLSLLIIPILLLSCNDPEVADKRNVKSFYYPIEELKEPLVYEYKPTNNDTLGTQYCYFSTIETDTATYFTANIYNRFFEVEQFSIEEVVKNGMLQKDYFLYTFDTTGTQLRIPAEIEYNNSFPFEVKDSSGVFLQKMTWTLSEDPLHTTTLIRNRRYIGDSSYDYQGKEYETIIFSLREIIDDFYDGHLETETSGIEIYAKGIGLIYYKKNISKDLAIEYELKDIYTMEELEKKFSEQ